MPNFLAADKMPANRVLRDDPEKMPVTHLADRVFSVT
jgi:hypothetical protein